MLHRFLIIFSDKNEVSHSKLSIISITEELNKPFIAQELKLLSDFCKDSIADIL